MLTLEQKEQRKGHIGASDMAAVMGLSKWYSPLDIWYEKTGKVKQDVDDEDDATIIGSELEGGILKIAERHLGPIEARGQDGKPFFIIEPTEGILAATLDGRVVDTKTPVESKYRGIFRNDVVGWGEPGSDDVPTDILIQCMVQMMCTKTNLCHIAAILAGRGFQMFLVERDDVVEKTIMEAAKRFWMFVTKGIEPDCCTASLDTLKRIIRQPKSVKPPKLDEQGKPTFIDIDPLVVALEEAKQRLKLAEGIKDEAYQSLVTAMGTFEAVQYSTGMVTYPEQLHHNEKFCPSCNFKLSDKGFCRKLYLKPNKGK